MQKSNVVELDEYRRVEDLIKLRLGAINVVISAELRDGQILTYIPTNLLDINLVYMIQNLKDRREGRVHDINS